jgi:hypothetical protein
MSVPLWAVEAADAFWTAAGESEPFPRALRRPIARALPLTVVSVSRLSVGAAEAWLRRRGGGRLGDIPERPLRACLVCRFGHGIVFLDGADEESEQRFSLAHELAHFLRDYHQPRRRVARALGGDVLAVLDGARIASTEERLSAALSRVTVRPYLHLMDRRDNPTVDAAENAADRLAFELLAPWEAVSAAIEARRLGRQPDAVRQFLESGFGLPARAARQYAALLMPAAPAPSPLLRVLRETALPIELPRDGPEQGAER